ncbi:Shaker pollen inward K+ channel isoform 1 [Hibiscus syriacus]|uniref:Shaker pollen inward K+ channel isoform 1 n=1 Tax=Hibiscus syriacus TaxID=106335 RepID=A0A6A2WUX1_HIBSY|nr:Shaker pollen inward K+ channel isoform 1 [Hibiscus syriacus]
MENIRSPFSGIIEDIKGRSACYKQDWVNGFRSGYPILSPTTYIFFASALPVIAFGEQPSRDTGTPLRMFNRQWLPQPSGNIGFYSYLWNHSLIFRVCMWTALMLILLAIFNACTIINRFTRIAGEIFGMLITVLFIQEAVKGVVSEFRIPKGENPNLEKYQFHWLFTNDLLAVIFSFGLLLMALKTRTARSWRYGTGWFRSFIAEYEVPLMEAFLSTFWEPESSLHRAVIKDMGKVPVVYIFAAIVPALMIAGLYFFDHSVASQLEQQKEFNLKNPPAYHYDVLLLGVMDSLLRMGSFHNLLCTLRAFQFSRHWWGVLCVDSEKNGRNCQGEHVATCKQLRDLWENASRIRRNGPIFSCLIDNELRNLKEAVMKSDGANDAEENFDPEKDIDPCLPVRVNGQRVSNLSQSLLIGLSLCALPVIKMIPTSLLWGYFAYMAIDSLPGNQFWERLLLLFVTPSRRYKVLEGDHASFMESLEYYSRCHSSFSSPSKSTSFQSFSILNIFRNFDLIKEKESSNSRHEGSEDDYYNAEILDGITTNRGELKHRSKIPKCASAFSIAKAAMEVVSFSPVEKSIWVCSVMETSLAETLVLAGKSLACLLMLGKLYFQRLKLCGPPPGGHKFSSYLE